MPAMALVREVESARESRPAELFAREQAVDLEFATSVNIRVTTRKVASQPELSLFGT
jgi:hypothetical protein